MTTPVAKGARMLLDERDVALARDVLSTLDGPEGFLSVGRVDESTQPLPREIGLLLQEVLSAVASGSTITLSTVPREVTTSTAAAILGISRPTLMKLVNSGSIPSHKVGTHTRLLVDDVLAAKKARRARERAAFAALLQAEDDE